MESEYNTLKKKYDDISYKNILLLTQNANREKQLDESKSEMSLTEKKLKEQNNELNEYKSKNSQLEINNSQLMSKVKEMEEKSKNFENLENITSELEKRKSGLMEENNRLENNKKILEQKCADLQSLSGMSIEDLQTKIISMKEVNDLLYKQLEESDRQKLEFESKLIKLQTTFNDQLEEEKREIVRLYKNKKAKENRELSFVSGEDAKNIVSHIDEANEEKKNINEERESVGVRMSLLYNENVSLKEVVKDLKKEIIDLKNKNSLNNKGYNLIGANMNVQKVDENSEKIIEDLMLECNKWKKEYSLMYNENGVLKKYISKLEKNIGVEEKMDNLRTLLAEKDQLLINLSYQIKEYQSKCDDIIIGKSEESKDKQIQLLLNEVKGIRKRILNIVTLNDRITNFDEFMEAIKTIKKLESTNKDKDIEKAFDQLNYLVEIYQQNDDNAFSKFVNEIYGEGKNINNLINFETFTNNNDDHNINNQNNNFDNGNYMNNMNNYNDNEQMNNNNNYNNNEENNYNEENNNNDYNNNEENNYNEENNNNNIENDNNNDQNNNEQLFDSNNNQNNYENENNMNNHNEINFNTNENGEEDENYNNNENNNENENEDEDENKENNNFNQDNNFNDNGGENNFNEDNNFGNAFDDINFEEFENGNLNEQNKENNNGDDDVL